MARKAKGKTKKTKGKTKKTVKKRALVRNRASIKTAPLTK